MKPATPHEVAVAARIAAGAHYRNPASRRRGPIALLDGLAPMPQDGGEDAVRTRMYRFAFSRCWFELSRPVVE